MLKPLTERETERAIAAADRLYDAHLIDSVEYENIMQRIRNSQEGAATA